MQKGVANLVLILGVIIIGLMVYGTFHIEDIRRFELRFPKATPTPNQTVKPTNSTKPSPTPDETVGWKSYSDPNFGFSFKIPSGWEVKQSDLSSSFIIAPINYKGKAVINLTFWDNSQNLSLQELNEKYTNSYLVPGLYLPNSKPVTNLSGLSANYLENVPLGSGVVGHQRYVIIHKNLVWTLTNNSSDNDKIFSLIFATFKFINNSVSADEKARIDIWISRNSLNQYGDSQETVYPGGTPLFDETSGQTIDRYEYIVGQHPDRPWNQ